MPANNDKSGFTPVELAIVIALRQNASTSTRDCYGASDIKMDDGVALTGSAYGMSRMV